MLTNLKKISRRIGERFDLVQAGGGNTSIKDTNGRMYIKASGVRLSDVQSEKQFAVLNYPKLLDLYHNINWQYLDRKNCEIKANSIIADCNLTSDIRPSIETLLHAVCPDSVVHTHPLVVLKAFSGGQNQQKFSDIFAFVPYSTPGIDLTLALDKSRNNFINHHSNEPEAIILENHGMVVYAENPELAFEKTLSILTHIQEKIGWIILNDYNYCNEISSVMESLTMEPIVTIFSGVIKLFENLKLKPFFPDGVVFLSAEPILINGTNLRKEIENFFLLFGVFPKVFIREKKVYISGSSYSKAREIQEVWDLYYQIIKSQIPLNYLDPNEVHYLSHWEAEKYRQKI